MPFDALPQAETAITTLRPFAWVIFDIETNGLLPAHVEPPYAMDRIHSLSVRCVQTKEKRSYVNDDLLPLSAADLSALEDLGITDVRPLSEGLELLLSADVILGHNIIDFDIPAIQLCFPDWVPSARIIDTLVMTRMVFADVKEADFRMLAKGQLEGRLLGMQGLEAWGQRLGLHKGDYSKDRKAELKELHREQGLPAPTDEEYHAYVWGTWNPAMHDYMILDVDVNAMLWDKIAIEQWPDQAVKLEHHIHALMVQQERNGFLFDREKAEKLADNLRVDYDQLSESAIAEIGKWYRPARVIVDKVDESLGETESRRTWGECFLPKRSMNFAKSNAKFLESGDLSKLRASTEEGAPIVKVELKEFNPNSRPQITDRLKVLYGWEPQDFTEKGSAKVDDEILRALKDDIPLAETLAEVFYVKKRLGQVADGKNGWLKLMRPDGRIHGRVNVGGTVSGRATHAAPNVSQVPGVNPVEIKDYDAGLKFIAEMEGQTDDWGRSLIITKKWNDKKGEWSIYTRGRSGGYGWDCRELFMAPQGFKLMGCDLSGVEFRCLANLCFPFDDGELVDIVLNGDIHQINADLAGISRSVAKRLLYACVDMETMALTKNGWKHYNDLKVGEMVMTYNMEKDIKEWKPIQHLHFVPGAKRVRVKGRGIDVVCTPDHRWATLRKRMVNGKYVWTPEYCRTDELTNSHRVIANAPFDGDRVSWGPSFDPASGKYEQDWPAIVMQMNAEERKAWLYGFLCADGCFRNDSGRWQFTQKQGVHYEAALAALYVDQPGRLSAYHHHHGNSSTMKVESCQSRTWGCQKIELEEIEDGDVWCMTTENSSFVMRRGDFVTITGNCMYGGGDAKLGSIVEPFANENRQRTVGKQLREKLMRAMPSLKAAIREIHREMRRNRGRIKGLDGRWLYARSKHSALNLRLQSDGALIAKKWCLLVDDAFYEEGWDHGVDLDYAFNSWSHDEIQVSVRDAIADRSARIAEEQAGVAGQYFNFMCPIAAEAKLGLTWSETH